MFYKIIFVISLWCTGLAFGCTHTQKATPTQGGLDEVALEKYQKKNQTPAQTLKNTISLGKINSTNPKTNTKGDTNGKHADPSTEKEGRTNSQNQSTGEAPTDCGIDCGGEFPADEDALDLERPGGDDAMDFEKSKENHSIY